MEQNTMHFENILYWLLAGLIIVSSNIKEKRYKHLLFLNRFYSTKFIISLLLCLYLLRSLLLALIHLNNKNKPQTYLEKNNNNKKTTTKNVLNHLNLHKERSTKSISQRILLLKCKHNSLHIHYSSVLLCFLLLLFLL